jgi:hypothetical protein
MKLNGFPAQLIEALARQKTQFEAEKQKMTEGVEKQFALARARGQKIAPAVFQVAMNVEDNVLTLASQLEVMLELGAEFVMSTTRDIQIPPPIASIDRRPVEVTQITVFYRVPPEA